MFTHLAELLGCLILPPFRTSLWVLKVVGKGVRQMSLFPKMNVGSVIETSLISSAKLYQTFFLRFVVGTIYLAIISKAVVMIPATIPKTIVKDMRYLIKNRKQKRLIQ